MDFIEIEGKTYEEAIKKASLELNAEEKDLDIDVKEVDTKGILGLLGSKKIRITARLKTTAMPETVEKQEVTENAEEPEEYGKRFLEEVSKFVGLSFSVRATKTKDRLTFLVQSDHGDIFIGKEGDVLESLQYMLRLAIAKRYKQGLKLLIDINGYREKRKKSLTIMAKRLADRVKRTGRPLKTDPLNPYERRVIHTLFKHNRNIKTKSEGEGHTKKVVISLNRITNGNRKFVNGNR
ncbi:MAG TPA: RNA-binding cell elongation regulator Jag/EloR [Syntrophorhabdaceae bacterium]|jgi:spoIIIJ-associated protein|nr:RNA-binding cell elongation regulator Jag/EloR [Syntrophorhabdaceae bacterium]